MTHSALRETLRDPLARALFSMFVWRAQLNVANDTVTALYDRAVYGRKHRWTPSAFDLNAKDPRICALRRELPALSGRLAEDPAPDAASGMPSNPLPDLLEKKT